jgi:hypothetical protein
MSQAPPPTMGRQKGDRGIQMGGRPVSIAGCWRQLPPAAHTPRAHIAAATCQVGKHALLWQRPVKGCRYDSADTCPHLFCVHSAGTRTNPDNRPGDQFLVLTWKPESGPILGRRASPHAGHQHAPSQSLCTTLLQMHCSSFLGVFAGPRMQSHLRTCGNFRC